MSREQVFASALRERQAQDRHRSLRSFVTIYGARISDGENNFVNFASNDYLGLSKHPELKARSALFLDRYGTGLGSSRLLSGNLSVYEQIESKLAKFKGTETALILASGYQTNSTVIAAIAQSADLFFSDHENHNSIYHGLQIARARFRRYHHNDLDHLRRHLYANTKSVNKWILTESVFSMDGTASDITELISISRGNNASVYVDEAHATGVLGEHGRGLAYGAGVSIAMGTFSKAMGSFGGYVACTNVMRDYLINFCGGLIYSTALPPAVLGAIDAALDVVPELDEERGLLACRSVMLRHSIRKLGFETLDGSTPIIPIILGMDKDALDLSQYLEQHQILAPAIRPPTVAEGTARLRLSITVDHTEDDIARLIDCLRHWQPDKKRIAKMTTNPGGRSIT
jgi:8-amino-7-oxononanoate synthase